jgi:kinesin family protein 1
MSEIKVAVRVRPFNSRERALQSSCIVAMQGASTLLSNPGDPAAPPRQFTFDHSFWSHTPADPHFATQEHVYAAIGSAVLDDAFSGYHSTVFACVWVARLK